MGRFRLKKSGAAAPPPAKLQQAVSEAQGRFETNMVPSQADFGKLFDAVKVAGMPFTRGMIMMFCGTPQDIPQGWVLCDGSNAGAPNLSDRFILGANADNCGQYVDNGLRTDPVPDRRYVDVAIVDQKITIKGLKVQETVLTEKHVPYHRHGHNIKFGDLHARNFYVDGTLKEELKEHALRDVSFSPAYFLTENSSDFYPDTQIRGLRDLTLRNNDTNTIGYKEVENYKTLGFNFVVDIAVTLDEKKRSSLGRIMQVNTMNYDTLTTGPASGAGVTGQSPSGHAHAIDADYARLSFPQDAVKVTVPYFALAFIMKE